MISRRDFLRTTTAAGAYGITKPIRALGSRYQTSSDYFDLHPFIENHPEAVFIMRTNVEEKTDSEAKRVTGLEFCRSVLVPQENGVPITSIIPIKPNLTNIMRNHVPEENIEYRMGIVTDPWFIEGYINGLKELGVSGNQVHLIETWHLSNWGPLGYDAMAERAGVHQNDTREITADKLSADKIQWIDVPDGVWFRKIPYIWPVNAPDTCLFNISKFKTHGMGLTLCCKNLQGTICHDYQLFCSTPKGKEEHFNPRREADVSANYTRHLADGIPRWSTSSSMEKWATRTLDNNSVTPVKLHIVEGVYGRDGNGFTQGPNKGTYRDDEAWDYMTNIIIFGKDQYRVDIVGHWLGYQEPGNFGLFHMAMERGYSTVLNPHSIPVYEWKDGQATLAALDDFERTPLKTTYLKQSGESTYHYCNEPFDYSTVRVEEPSRSDRPEVFHLGQNYPNPFNPFTSIEYYLPRSSYARLEIYNSAGQLVDVPVNRYMAQGSHMASWNSFNHASGVYYYHFRSGDFAKTKKMLLLR